MTDKFIDLLVAPTSARIEGQPFDLELAVHGVSALQFADDPAKHFRRIHLVEIRVVSLPNSDLCQSEMQIRLHAVTFKASPCAMKRTTIDGDDLPSRLGNAYEGGNVPADAGNARHICVPLAVQADCDVVRHLRGTRAARARIHDRHFRIVSSHVVAR